MSKSPLQIRLSIIRHQRQHLKPKTCTPNWENFSSIIFLISIVKYQRSKQWTIKSPYFLCHIEHQVACFCITRVVNGNCSSRNENPIDTREYLKCGSSNEKRNTLIGPGGPRWRLQCVAGHFEIQTSKEEEKATSTFLSVCLWFRGPKK